MIGPFKSCLSESSGPFVSDPGRTSLASLSLFMAGQGSVSGARNGSSLSGDVLWDERCLPASSSEDLLPNCSVDEDDSFAWDLEGAGVAEGLVRPKDLL